MGSNGWINGGGSMQIGVGLSLELGEGHGNQLSSSRSSNGFTFLQLQELEQQTLIYKCMEAGLPVPSHLIFPIWKSVVSSLSGLGGRIHPNHYNLVNYSPWWCYDNTYSIDPEPGRCRRTDGKKWRCSRDVVPGRKYCERHMHRGRQRSRKHVEASQLPNYVTSITRKLDYPKSDTGLTISLPSSSNAGNVSPR